MNAVVQKHRDAKLQDLGGGVSRRVLAHDGRMMLVEVCFETGARGGAHTHPHAQSSYVKSGAFRFTIDGEDVEVRQGDTICFAPDALHGTLCLEAGVLIDVFSPAREDFL